MNAARKLLAAATLALALIGAAPAAAAVADTGTTARAAAVTTVHADTSSGSSGGSGTTSHTSLTPATTMTVSDQCQTDGTKCLPYNRWNGASMTLHGRFDNLGQVLSSAYAQRAGMATLFMSAGNGLFQVGAGFVSLSDKMDPIKAVGYTADQAMRSFGNVLIGSGSPIPALLLALGIGTAVFGLRRGVPPWKRLISTISVYGILAAMIGGAAMDTTTSFGVGSPAWLATTTNTAISGIVNKTAAGLEAIKVGTGSNATTYGDCGVYVTNLITEANASKNPPTSTELTLNDAWMQTGLQSFKTAQYGSVQIEKPNGNNPGETFGDEAYCHQLENQANIPASQQQQLFFSGNVPSNADATSAIWGNNSSNTDVDQTLVGAAACQFNGKSGAADENNSFTVRPGFTKDDSGQNITPNTCFQVFFGANDQTPDDLDFGSQYGDVTSKYQGKSGGQASLAAMSYINTLHGDSGDNQGAFILGMWAVAALLWAAILSVIAIAVIFAKFMCVALIFSLAFAAISWVIVPNGTEGMVKYGKMYLSFAVVATGASLILAVILKLSNVLQDAAAGMLGGPGSIFTILWSGLSPLMSALLLHFMFKRLFKGFSPMSPTGALGLAAAASGGTIGGIVGSNLVNRFQNRAVGAARGAGKTVAGATGRGALRAGTGGRLGQKDGQGRLGRMTPELREKKAALAAAGKGGGVVGGPGAKGQLPRGKGGVDESVLAEAPKEQKKTTSERFAKGYANTADYLKNADNFRTNLHKRVIDNAKAKAMTAKERVSHSVASMKTSVTATTQAVKNDGLFGAVDTALRNPVTWKAMGETGKVAGKAGAGFILAGPAGAGAMVAHHATKSAAGAVRKSRDEKAEVKHKEMTELHSEARRFQGHVNDARREHEKAIASLDHAEHAGDADKIQKATERVAEAKAGLDHFQGRWDKASAAVRDRGKLK